MEEIDNNDLRDGCRAQAALAQFAHEQYIVINDYMQSPQFESLKECIVYQQNTVSKILKSTNDREVVRTANISNKQSRNDWVELENIEKDRDMYLSIAVR